MDIRGEEKTVVFLDEVDSMPIARFLENIPTDTHSKNLPPDAEWDENYVRMVRINFMRSNLSTKLLANNLHVDEDYLRNLLKLHPRYKG